MLFHNAAKHTPEALPRIIEKLQSDGYKMVKIDELIYKDNYYMDNAGMQIPIKTNSDPLPDNPDQQAQTPKTTDSKTDSQNTDNEKNSDNPSKNTNTKKSDKSEKQKIKKPKNTSYNPKNLQSAKC